MEKLCPIKISYVAKSRIWGGKTLYERFSKGNGSENIGETWELTVRDDETSVVLSGDYAGLTLREYIEKNSGVLGTNYKGGRFPLLIKFIDACECLSVQVHPDDEYAEKTEHGLGKTEMWYIIDAKKGAKIVYGFADNVTREEFAKAARNGNIDSVLGWREVRAGETYFIPSGLLHAIGEGILIAEIQQNSDLTYRVFDYDRKDANGNRRELHVEKAIDVSRPFDENEINAIRFSERDELDDENTLAHCRYFRVSKYSVSGEKVLGTTVDSFASFLCISGKGSLVYEDVTIDFSAGDSIFVPAGLDNIHVLGENQLIVSSL